MAKKIKILGWENALIRFFRVNEELFMQISNTRVAKINLYVNKTFVICMQFETHKSGDIGLGYIFPGNIYIATY